jgi:DNA-binding NarL/FixJ family response regulator
MNPPELRPIPFVSRLGLTRQQLEQLNLYASRNGIAQLALELTKIIDDIESARINGHLSERLSAPSAVRYAAIEALRESVRRSILPPDELVELLARLVGTPDEPRRRGRQKIPSKAVRIIQAETSLSGRELAGKLGVSEATVRRYRRAASSKT